MTEHLGGYIEGGDPATFFPDLWQWIVREHQIESVLDIGCGEGHSTKFFRELGVDSVGIDGIDAGADVVHDFTTGPWRPKRSFGMVWACEFVEHVEERYLPNLAPAFSSSPLVLMTHAFPGQAGFHHVNCRDADYWRGVMAAWGFFQDITLTNQTRGLAAVNTNPYNHYLRSGMAFRQYR